MIRNLKALGLALVAVFAMSAMAATAAQAEDADFWAEDPALISATGEGDQIFQVNTNPALVCQDEGEDESVHGIAELLDEGPSLTSENLEYTNCHTIVFGLTFPVTVDTNGCDYHFVAGTMIGASTSEGSVEVKCPAEKEITVTVFSTSNHAQAPRCVIHVPPQKVKGSITYTNITSGGKMAVTATTDNASVEATKTDLNTLGCNTHETDKEATYEGSFIATARNAGGAQIDTTVTGTE